MCVFAVIQSGHDTSFTLVARLLSKAGRWVWVASVMSLRSGSMEGQETVIVCSHQVIDDEEAKQLKVILAKCATSPPTPQDFYQQQQQQYTNYAPTMVYNPAKEFMPAVTIEGTFSVWDSGCGGLPSVSGGQQLSVGPWSYSQQPQQLPPNYVSAMAPVPASTGIVHRQQQQLQFHSSGKNVQQYHQGQGSLTLAPQPGMKRKSDQAGFSEYQVKRSPSSFQTGATFEDLEVMGCLGTDSLEYLESCLTYGSGSGSEVLLATQPTIHIDHTIAMKNKLMSSSPQPAVAFPATSFGYPPTPEVYISDVMAVSPSLHVDTRSANDCLVPQTLLTPVASPATSACTDGSVVDQPTYGASLGNCGIMTVCCSSEDWLTEITDYLKSEEKGQQAVLDAAAASHLSVLEYEANIVDALGSSLTWEGHWKNFGRCQPQV